MSRLARFSLDRRIAVLVLLATLLVVGVVATVGIPLELFPRGFSHAFLAINVPWQDAPAQEVLDKIVLPLEEEVSTVRGLERVSSFATTGFGRLALQFRHGTDMNVAYREVRDRIERARARLPEDADKVFIRKDDVSGIPVSVLGLLVPEGMTGVYDLIQNQVVLPLERIEGVATVSPEGLEEKEILIELDRQKTEAAGLNIYQLAQELGGDNFTMAAGDVRSGGKELLLRSVARYRDQDELADRLVAPSVRLRDVATVRYAEPDKEYRIRVNSTPAIGIEIIKEGEANTLAVSKAIRAAVEKMKEDPRLARIVAKCLSPDPAGRYVSAERLGSDLRAWLGRLKVTERVVGFERKRIHGQETIDQTPRALGAPELVGLFDDAAVDAEILEDREPTAVEPT